MVRSSLFNKLSRVHLRLLFCSNYHPQHHHHSQQHHFCRLSRSSFLLSAGISTWRSVPPLVLEGRRRSFTVSAVAATAAVGGGAQSPRLLPLLIYKQSIIIDSALLSGRSYHGWTNRTSSTATDLVLSTRTTANRRTAAAATTAESAQLQFPSASFRSVGSHARIDIQVPHLLSYLRRPGRSPAQVDSDCVEAHSTARNMVTSSLPLRKTSNRFLSAFLTIYYLLEGLIIFFIPESWKQKDVTGQIILITGGGSGIGQLTAINFLKLGAKVVIWDVSRDGMDKTVQMMRDAQLNTNNVFCYKINLCDRNSIYETAKRVQQDVGVVDILINNAGVVSGKSFLDIPDEKIQLTMDVNTMAHFWTCKAFLPDMVKRNKGHIVTVASVAGNLAGCNMSDYHASKFANVGFDLALRMELAQADLDGIKTSIVKPYFITTGMFSGVRTDLIPFLQPEYVAEKIVSGIRAETRDIVIPYYFMHFFWLIILFPAKCLIPMSDFLGGFDFMSHFEGREGQKSEINNNSLTKNGVNNNNTETKKAN